MQAVKATRTKYEATMKVLNKSLDEAAAEVLSLQVRRYLVFRGSLLYNMTI